MHVTAAFDSKCPSCLEKDANAASHRQTKAGGASPRRGSGRADDEELERASEFMASGPHGNGYFEAHDGHFITNAGTDSYTCESALPFAPRPAA